MRSIKALSFTAAAAGVALLSGCAMTERTPVTGCIYSDVKGGHFESINSGVGSTKSGQTMATSILGWIGQGDASIATAASKGGISKVAYVDYKTTNILGFYATYTTTVYGE